MARWLAPAMVAGLGARCREAIEGRFIDYRRGHSRPTRRTSVWPSATPSSPAPTACGCTVGWSRGRTSTVLVYAHGNGGNIGDRVVIARLLVGHLGSASS